MKRCKQQIILVIILFLFQSIAINGQQFETKDTVNNKQTYITARYSYGFTIPHHVSMLYLLEDFVHGVELNYGVANFSKNHWGSYFNYPEMGIGAMYTTLGNKEVFGNAYAVYPYVNFHISRKKRFNASYKVGVGLGYSDTPYDLAENPENRVFGSKFNIYVGFGLLTDYKISNHLSLLGAFTLNHWSNGAVQKPNHGVNVASVTAGVKYHLSEEDYPTIEKVRAPKSKKKEFIGVLSMGRSHSHSLYTQKHWSASLNLNYLWHSSAKRACGVGADVIYYGDAPYYFDYASETDDEFTTADFMYGGLLGSYNVFLNRVTMVMQLGVYVFYETKPDQPLYTRLGLRYNINDRLLANFSVKAGFFKSEFLEFGLGYRIHSY
ncbi:acyloxyacyl hydrolase [Labilibacter sediminis]|nr:acyloxyacyl hydrolase [Labilibacter sediminis]